MKFFIDTANVDEIRKANDMGVICGVTTNPSLIAKEGKDYVETLKEIASIVDGPISGEVKATTTDAEGMIAEGREIAKIHPNMVVKIPMTVEGLKATKVLSSEGIKVNVTLIFSANQALLAARAGAAYVCFISVAPQYSSKCISIYLVLLSNSNISAALFAKLLISQSAMLKFVLAYPASVSAIFFPYSAAKSSRTLSAIRVPSSPKIASQTSRYAQ